jgi:1,4-alpha-glucan branching enzyme
MVDGEEIMMNVRNDKPRLTEERPEATANGTIFVCNLKPEAREVYLVGEFNNWDPRADRMVKTKGAFRKTMQLAPGEYQYKFLVDGQWHNDPTAPRQIPNAFGTTNSVVRVSDPTRK